MGYSRGHLLPNVQWVRWTCKSKNSPWPFEQEDASPLVNERARFANHCLKFQFGQTSVFLKYCLMLLVLDTMNRGGVTGINLKKISIPLTSTVGALRFSSTWGICVKLRLGGQQISISSCFSFSEPSLLRFNMLRNDSFALVQSFDSPTFHDLDAGVRCYQVLRG